MSGLLSPEGPVARVLAAFESRPQQVRMAVAVEDALRSKRHLIVEAGTGVGKSFAYLVPALKWASETGGKVAVATSTIALQEQLVGKDLPALRKALPFEVPFTLVKGRGNYVCKRRMYMAVAQRDGLFPEPEASAQLHSIAAWAEAGGESLQDLPFTPRGDVWDSVRAEHGNCLHRACPHYDRCAYQAGKRRAHSAGLLVLNHHVLLADLALRRSGVSFLPKVDAIVVDEAHDLEDAAAEHLGSRLASRGVSYVLGRLWNEKRRSGLLAAHPDQALRDAVVGARDAARRFFDGLAEAVVKQGGESTAPLDGEFPVADSLSGPLATLSRAIDSGVPAAPSPDVGREMAVRALSLDAMAEEIADVVAEPDDGQVRWAEWAGGGDVEVRRAPIDVGPLLKVALYDAFDTVVLTSATLSTGRPPSFEFVRDRLGLADAEEMSVGSPFDFARQARIVVRTDLPDPARDPAAYEASLPEAVLEAVRRTKGGAFVLFTSNESMRRVADAVRAHFEGDGLTVLVQGEDLPRTAMLERFRAENAVLFGVSSFWQGVDVPGDALRNVVIARLPFDVPTHPLQRAKQARIEAQGRSAFERLSLPSAAIRLKQGFGRLIRRATDKGIVVILDPRVVTRAYGRRLLDTLPECPVDLEPPVPES